ncbi:MAG: sensor histidine kinase N-terminal domain-containing protein [Proteobacteria bacterium]|nr:sensor histidine kinase N-terminal domain-containing protein [Pseudomonadota bacterium]
MMRLPTSLRLRLVLCLGLASCLLWGGVALWRSYSLERELNAMLDERLVASAKMVAGIVHQFQPTPESAAGAAQPADLQTVIGRDGVACEVSLVRSEVGILPLARTGDTPENASHGAAGFGYATKGGKAWRTYVLEDGGLRVATADRLDTRAQLVRSAWRALALPFALALTTLLLLVWWISTLTLRPLQRLQQELRERAPQDPTPVQAGRGTLELAPVVTSLNQLLARMDAAIAHERRWTADAAHELRTPLTAIKTHVQVAQMALAGNTPPQAAAQALAHASEGVAHMQHTLEQLLQLARVESAGGAETSLTQGAAIAQAVNLALQQSQQRARAEHWPHTQAQLVQAPAGATAWQHTRIALPPALLTCAVTNLLDNALRHQQGDAAVGLTLRLGEGGGVDIEVRDHGPGLTEQECAQALQRFWRKSSNGPGSGLGLTIVRRIAESAGGSLSLAPARPGLLARLHLPAPTPSAGSGHG